MFEQNKSWWKYFTVLSQVFIHDQFSVAKVVQDGAEVCGVPVDQVGSSLILWEQIKGWHVWRGFGFPYCKYCSLFAEMEKGTKVESDNVQDALNRSHTSTILV